MREVDKNAQPWSFDLICARVSRFIIAGVLLLCLPAREFGLDMVMV